MSVTIGERIRDIRKAHKMNQEQLAEASGVSRISIARYETNVIEPGAQALLNIATALGVSVDVLLGRTAEDMPRDDALAASIMRERVRNDPAYRLLFDAAGRATSDHVRAAAEMLRALEKKGDS